MRGAADTWPAGGDIEPLGDDPVSMVLSLLMLLLLLPALLAMVLAGVELALLVLLLPFVLVGRVALGQHWHVEARRGWTPVWETDAGDWRASGEKIFEVAAAIERGELPVTAA